MYQISEYFQFQANFDSQKSHLILIHWTLDFL